jgi:hypothetical protein
MSVHFILAEDYFRIRPNVVFNNKIAAYRADGYKVFATAPDNDGHYLWVIEFENEGDAAIFKLKHL